MKRAMISELKNRLSYYLRFVRRGEPVLVYDRDRVIARIEPVSATSGADDTASHIEELQRRGILRAPAASLKRNWLEQRPVTTADVVGALIEERESGR